MTDLALFRWFASSWFGGLSPRPIGGPGGPEWQFLGARAIIASISNRLNISIVLAFVFLFVLVLFRGMLRKEWAGAVAFVLFFTVFFNSATLFAGGRAAVVAFVVGLILNGLSVILLIRLGLLALTVSIVFGLCFLSLPLTTQGSAWYADVSLAGILIMAAIALWALYVSLGGRPVFGRPVLED